ncbi:MAG: endopeptidase La [Prevotellaceae bacterium]|jgi:ATP-dependent Lon protease|nr:endopeptidase La [Prevotellaceae bacterium]
MAINIKIDPAFLAEPTDENTNFIPISISADEDNKIEEQPESNTIPILALRNAVLFPGVLIPITVGRDKSIRLVREVYKGSKILGAVAQIDASMESPEIANLHKIGTLARILKIIEMPDGAITAVLQGTHRFEIEDAVENENYLMAKVKYLKEEKPTRPDADYEAIADAIKDLALKIIRLSSHLPQEASIAIKNIESKSFLINFVASNAEFSKLSEKQELLEISSLKDRGYKLLEILNKEIQVLEIKDDIQRKVRSEIDQQQREYYLNQQMKTIQDELGGSPADQEIEEFKKQAEQKKWTKEVEDHFNKEIEKLERMSPHAAEFSMQITYLQLMLDLPWNEYTKDQLDIDHAQEILDEDHYGLEQVKERILEYLAVIKLKGDLKSPIICLYGPPGVGKTSLGKSVARALGREYGRISLGGLHDEAEIRGHRKTYIGAMPGRIIQTIKRCKSSNPVIILDEIDKVGKDFRGDPSSALLEVLDPEQNSAFHDNYLDVDYDLSKVLFITTANDISTINAALRDRMEMINMSGYLVEEKIQIAKRHLVPKQMDAHRIPNGSLELKEDVLEIVVDKYTRESGVRALDKEIAKLMRYYAKQIASSGKFNQVVSADDIRKILGVPKYIKEEYEGNDFAGVVTGLAWTQVGGEILVVETSLSHGKGKLTITGNLGDVMKESATIALEYIKSHAEQIGINPDIFEKWDLHLHVPEGAIPKDGPSAGITMATAIASAFTQRKVKRNLAMTGEITLRGKVLPVGGIKEKILAAKRAGVKEIILSEENRKDIGEIKEIYIKGVKFHYVNTVSDILNIALLKEKVKNPINISC